jgi:hypothetical protein
MLKICQIRDSELTVLSSLLGFNTFFLMKREAHVKWLIDLSIIVWSSKHTKVEEKKKQIALTEKNQNRTIKPKLDQSSRM